MGTLERTKNSGLGKALQVLPVFVSEDAWLVQPWLDTGLALWRQEPLSYPRDYFLPLPNETLDGVLQRRALYTDSACFSVGLLSSLTAKDGFALLPTGGPLLVRTQRPERPRQLVRVSGL